MGLYGNFKAILSLKPENFSSEDKLTGKELPNLQNIDPILPVT